MKKHASTPRFPQLHWIATTPVASAYELLEDIDLFVVTEISYPSSYFHAQKPNGKRKSFADNIICHDGTKISVQACAGMYCQPRTNNAPWTHFEVCVFSAEVGLRWMRRYADLNTYGYVPLAKVEQLIKQHGGEKDGKHFKLKLPRKLKKALKNVVIKLRASEHGYTYRPKTKEVLILDAYNRTQKTNSMYRLGQAAGKYHWWTVSYRRALGCTKSWYQK